MLEWDTKHFGFPVAEVTHESVTNERIEEVDAWCARNRPSCVYFRVPASDSNSLALAQQHGFRYVDARLDFEKSIDAVRTSPVSFETAVASDKSALVEIATDAFSTQTRFAVDPGFPQEKVAELYTAWVGRSIEGDFDDEVLVKRIGPDPVGFVTLRREQQGTAARIGLIAASAAARGQGVGTELVGAAVAWAASQGAGQLAVATQLSNASAQRLYQRAGFLSSGVYVWLHRWPELEKAEC